MVWTSFCSWILNIFLHSFWVLCDFILKTTVWTVWHLYNYTGNDAASLMWSEWCSTCLSKLPTAIATFWLFLAPKGCSLLAYMHDHDPVWSGNRSTEWDYYSYYNTEQESTLKQMLEPFVESLAWSPTLPTFTAIYMAIQLLSPFLLLSFLLPSLACALSLCLCRYIFPTSFLFSPRRLKSNTCPHINFDQSNLLICLAGETVTYQCRLSYSEMKKTRRRVSQNILGVT